MLVSDDEKLIGKARFFATQSREPARHYQHKKIGYNYRMSNIVAGIGRAQMQVLDARVERKKEIFKRYKKNLSGLDGLSFMEDAPYGESNKWLTVIRLNQTECPVNPLAVMDALEKQNIESRPVWKPMHLQPVFDTCEFFAEEEGRDVSTKLFEQGVCLPSGTQMTEAEQDRVIEIIKGLWK